MPALKFDGKFGKRTRANGCLRVLSKQFSISNCYTEVVFEMGAQILGQLWASHFVKVTGSGDFRENECKRIFCKNLRTGCTYEDES